MILTTLQNLVKTGQELCQATEWTPEMLPATRKLARQLRRVSQGDYLGGYELSHPTGEVEKRADRRIVRIARRALHIRMAIGVCCEEILELIRWRPKEPLVQRFRYGVFNQPLKQLLPTDIEALACVKLGEPEDAIRFLTISEGRSPLLLRRELIIHLQEGKAV